MIRPQMVNAAAGAIRTFGGPYLIRPQAAFLLGQWGHRYALTGPEVVAVLDRFGPASVPVPDGVDGYQVGGRR